MTPTIGLKFFNAWAVIVTSQSDKTPLLAWHYFWLEEIRSDTFWTDLVPTLLYSQNWLKSIHIILFKILSDLFNNRCMISIKIIFVSVGTSYKISKDILSLAAFNVFFGALKISHFLFLII